MARTLPWIWPEISARLETIRFRLPASSRRSLSPWGSTVAVRSPSATCAANTE